MVVVRAWLQRATLHAALKRAIDTALTEQQRSDKLGAVDIEHAAFLRQFERIPIGQ